MKLNLDLAQGGPSCCSEPCGIDRPYYPSFHYSGDKELALPREGTMTIRFKKCSSSESENSKGEETYSCTVDVVEIISVEGSEPKKSASKQTEDALDALAKAKYDEDGEDE